MLVTVDGDTEGLPGTPWTAGHAFGVAGTVRRACPHVKGLVRHAARGGGVGHHGAMRSPRRPARPQSVPLTGLLLTALLVATCETSAPAATPAITPGTGAAPRALNIVAREYSFAPGVVDLVPGETVVLHVINAGLEVHEAVIGDLADQLAWEAAEAATVGHPPGPTPFVPDPPGFDGVRVVVGSGELAEVTWTVPTDAPQAPDGWFVGCHIPGHWAKGMVVPVRFVGSDGGPLGTPPPLPGASVP